MAMRQLQHIRRTMDKDLALRHLSSEVVCRLCLNIFKSEDGRNNLRGSVKREKPSVELMDLVSKFLPVLIELFTSEDVSVCSRCYEFLHILDQFRSSCFYCESLVIEVKAANNGESVELRDVVEFHTNKKIQKLPNKQICRLCLEYIGRHNGELLQGGTPYKMYVETCLPETSLDLIWEATLCNKCALTVKHMYKFREVNFKINNLLNDYFQTDTINKVTHHDIIEMSYSSFRKTLDEVQNTGKIIGAWWSVDSNVRNEILERYKNYRETIHLNMRKYVEFICLPKANVPKHKLVLIKTEIEKEAGSSALHEVVDIKREETSEETKETDDPLFVESDIVKKEDPHFNYCMKKCFQCAFCERTYKKRYSLSHHCNRIHQRYLKEFEIDKMVISCLNARYGLCPMLMGSGSLDVS